jgi:hypothetical protein
MSKEKASRFSDQVIRTGDVPIHFIVCRDSNNHIVYYFLRGPEQKIKRLRESRDKVVKPQDYGIVVASGFGRVPSKAVKRLLKERYMYDFDALNDVPEEDYEFSDA